MDFGHDRKSTMENEDRIEIRPTVEAYKIK